VDDLGQVGRGDPGLGADLMHPVDDRVLGRGIGGQHLGRETFAALFQNHVGKGAANVYAQSNG